MTKSKLIEKLKDIPEDAEILFTYEYFPQCNCDEYCYCSYVTETRPINEARLLKDGTNQKINGGNKIVLSEY